MNPRSLVPKKVFFTSGVGVADDPLLSFEYALRNAKIEKFNLVSVSSIAPPNIKIIDIDEGLKYLKAGQVVFCVLSRFTSNEKGREIFSSVGVALPKDKKLSWILYRKGRGICKKYGKKYVKVRT
jgi:arginine decarboxylase